MKKNADHPEHNSRIFSSSYIVKYLTVSIVMAMIVVLYHIFTSFSLSPPSNMPPGNPNQGGAPMVAFSQFWPIWGVLLPPNIFQIFLVIAILVGALIITKYVMSRLDTSHILIAIVSLAFATLVLSNLIQGWEAGIVSSIGGLDEIYQDALRIESILEFIMDYNDIQSTLTTHALTQPPGAVISIYILLQIFGDPGLIAIGLALVCTITSVIPLRSIFRKFFVDEIANWGSLLFAFLPAIQVYYLANVYAIVSSLVIITLYFYIHDNQLISFIGSVVFMFLGTFTSFLFLTIPLIFLIYEILQIATDDRVSKMDLIGFMKPIMIGISVLLIYGLLYLTLDFNYLEAFLYASSSENPNGFTLFSDPFQYFITRIQNIMDILVFLGPFLIVLCYLGIRLLRETEVTDEHKQMLLLVLASFVALGFLFLTGAPKKGETARICMFILPFVLMPVLYEVQSMQYSRRDKFLLLALVLIQALLLQTIGVYVW